MTAYPCEYRRGRGGCPDAAEGHVFSGGRHAWLCRKHKAAPGAVWVRRHGRAVKARMV